MPSRLNIAWPEVALYRVHEELERELLAASDEEVMEAARDLGMNPAMKGSAAFAGLKYPTSRRQMEEFFGVDWRETEFGPEGSAERLAPLIAWARQRKNQADK